MLHNLLCVTHALTQCITLECSKRAGLEREIFYCCDTPTGGHYESLPTLVCVRGTACPRVGTPVPQRRPRRARGRLAARLAVGRHAAHAAFALPLPPFLSCSFAASTDGSNAAAAAVRLRETVAIGGGEGGSGSAEPGRLFFAR